MKLYVIAGEISGDFIGGLLIKAIKELVKDQTNVTFHGIGGKNMMSGGVKSLFEMSYISMMGFFEVLPHIFHLKKLIDQTVKDVIAQNPDVLVTIDSPGFTYRVASKIREIAPHIKLVHIVAPSVWAYKPGRAKKYAKVYDHLLTLLPFEPAYFRACGLQATCIGHPILEEAFYIGSKGLKQEMNINENVKVISVTPGSRLGEISRHMPIIRQVFDELSSTHAIKVIFVQSDESNVQNILKYLGGAKFEFGFSTDRLKTFAISDCALAKSGTYTIEIAASGTPMIVGYKLNPLTFFFLKLMVKIKYASLINIISNREIIPEYIQSDFNAENVTQAISDLLSDYKGAKSQVAESQKVLESIGFNSDQKPSNIAAKIVVDMIR